MFKLKLVLVGVAACVVAGCQGIPDDMSIAQYCADPDKANTDVCKVNVELDGQRHALADTNLTVAEARAVADAASTKADDAMIAANAAMTREDEIYCDTQTVNRTNVGTCSPGYKVMSCTQTRYTYRAGGLSFMRSIDDQECRFNERVLEIQVRCCMAGAGPKPIETPISRPTVDRPEDLVAS